MVDLKIVCHLSHNVLLRRVPGQARERTMTVQEMMSNALVELYCSGPPRLWGGRRCGLVGALPCVGLSRIGRQRLSRRRVLPLYVTRAEAPVLGPQCSSGEA